MPSTLILLFVLALLSLVHSQTVQYVVKNNCPSPITLFIGGVDNGLLPTGASVTKSLGVDAGPFYTNTNGGSPKAVFSGKQFYYYLVKDPSSFNIGLSITPSHASTGGFCAKAQCNSVSCSTAFSPPLNPASFPAPVCNAPPSPPLYSCPFSAVSYDIVFCPPETPSSQEIHPNSNPNKCLDVRGAIFANGTPVQIYNCNGTPAQKWIIKKGSTKVQVAGTSFCLDAGLNPGNGVGMKIWHCFDDLPPQAWYYTNQNTIALQGTGFCLDLPNGVLSNGNVVQTWECGPPDLNRIWTL